MSDLEQAAEEILKKDHPECRHFLRFTRGQRYLHAALFSSFLGLASGRPKQLNSGHINALQSVHVDTQTPLRFRTRPQVRIERLHQHALQFRGC